MAGLLLVGSLSAQLASAQGRGQLLYETHCITCHTTQVHWREQRLAKDWGSLRKQVQRWQSVASLNWTEQDVEDVTRHLNTRYYGFDGPERRAAQAPPR